MPQAIVSILIESVLRPTKVDIRALDEIIALVRSLSSGQLQEESGNIQALVEGLDKVRSKLLTVPNLVVSISTVYELFDE